MLSYNDLFDYFKRERAGLIQAFESMPNEEFTKDRGLSFGSLKDVFVHTVMVEDNWLHYRAAGLGHDAQRKLEDFKNLRDVKDYIAEVDAKTVNLFKKMTDRDLKREIKRVRPDGNVDLYALEDLLYHLPIEIIHHYGEIFAEFWKMNLNAPYYSYLAYSKDRTSG